MNFEQMVTKYSQLSGRSQADSASAVTAFIQILTDAIKEEEDHSNNDSQDTQNNTKAVSRWQRAQAKDHRQNCD
jgi:hypothetical protein